jgi:hypothetical protein
MTMSATFEHGFGADQHADFYARDFRRMKTGRISGIPVAFKPSRLVGKILFAMQRPDDSAFNHERFIRQLFPIPYRPRRNYSGKREAGQCGGALLVGVDAALGRIVRKTRAVGEPRAEGKFIGEQNIGTSGGEGAF